MQGERLKTLGFTDWLQLESDIIEKDTLRDEAWEETLYVEMKFNRLVLFRGNEMFHGHTHSFGRDPNDARLTQNFFFDELRGE